MYENELNDEISGIGNDEEEIVEVIWKIRKYGISKIKDVYEKLFER